MPFTFRSLLRRFHALCTPVRKAQRPSLRFARVAGRGRGLEILEDRLAPAATGTITTVAGGIGDGLKATQAYLAYPQKVAVDAAGDLFISDATTNTVREVNQATGVITTVVGNGVAGYSGDGGPATSAELNGPIGLALDAAGDLYIGDTSNNVVRMVNHATGVITTVAGNGNQGYSGDGQAAASAQLNSPTYLVVGSSGDLFIADSGNNRVREVNHATGVITTVAGNGNGGYSGDGEAATSAQLNFPQGLAMDAAGNLFIADSSNNRIREVNHATGNITTVAGNGTGGESGDTGPATTAELNYPTDVTVDPAGDLFIADTQNYSVREVNHATGVITQTSYMGGGQFGVVPEGVTADGSGNVYVAGGALQGNYFEVTGGFDGSVQKIDHATGVTTTVAGNGCHRQQWLLRRRRGRRPTQ